MGVVRRTISPHAKRLRQNLTDAERALWNQLRARRLNGLKFKRQWTLGPYVVDFCCSGARLVVEVDGGQHDHARDAARTEWLLREGYCVVRFWNHEVFGNLEGVLQAIAIEAERHPHPDQCGFQPPCPGGKADAALPQAGEGVQAGEEA